jgi:hypothetical protein
LCKKRELGLHCLRFIFRLHVAKKHQKRIPCYKRYKNFKNFLDEIAMDYKGEAKNWMKKPKLDENRIKIEESFIISHP